MSGRTAGTRMHGEREPMAPERRLDVPSGPAWLLEVLRTSEAVVWARGDPAGRVLDANHGFHMLIHGNASQGGTSPGTMLHDVLAGPTWSELDAAGDGPNGLRYRGQITFVGASGESHSLRGALIHGEDEVLLVAEHDVGGYRQLIEHTLRANDEMARMQRDLARTKAELEHNREELRQQAVTDDLTGLKNRRFLTAWLEVEVDRARRDQAPLSVVMLDLDGFKQINDRLGHGVGDSALQAVAGVLHGCVRGYDVAARLGGDEMLVALPNTALDQAARVAWRIHDEIEANEVEGLDVPLRVSIGVVIADPSSDTVATLMRKADEALYAAKHAGRDRVVVHAREGEGEA